MSATYHNDTLPNGVDIHYVQAGDRTKPTLLLLHGYPSSSNQYRNLIPRLSDIAHIVAPDLPGFGLTTTAQDYQHTFANLAVTLGQLVDKLEIKTFSVYIFDYGAPTAFRLALERPQAITAIITQNGNAYEEGLGDWWAPLKGWWASGVDQGETRQAVRNAALNLQATKSQYVDGSPSDRLDRINPTTYHSDYLYNLADPAKQEVQLDLFFNYATNLDLYPRFQAYLRESRVPVLAIWGKNDPIFIPPGAEAYKKDNKNAEVVLLDGGHFLLETHVDEVAEKIRAFLAKI